MYVSVCSYALFSVALLAGSSRSLIKKIVHGFTPPPVQNQYVIQGMGGRRSVAEDATDVVFVVSRDESQPVNL